MQSYNNDELNQIVKFYNNLSVFDRELSRGMEQWIEECCKEFVDNYTNKTITSADSFVIYNLEYLEKSVSYISRCMYSKFENWGGKKLMAELGLSEEMIVRLFCKNDLNQLLVIKATRDFVESVCELGLQINIAHWNDELNKATRGRVIGGGFGIKGTIKGMAVAGIANSLIGAGYSVRNTLADVGRILRRDNIIIKKILNRETRDYMQRYLRGDLGLLYNVGLYVCEKLGLLLEDILYDYGI